ncbi:GDSL esterase/lipase [Actinidia chinensis var. chinensis]|uniref:GDSL esterase/lipase n=1 Tax=Actinidia chinensis var. chinensis TaxID=1590841 RepID=A0A2R6Q6S9_ACTCC|nr:GDSL esterase/lipase [Actinidia chinensis var. chinensis]
MAFEVKTCVMVITMVTFMANLLLVVDANQQVPCYFIFGDSLVDNGNNNLLQSAAKSNYPPYGIDFPEGPTGRFTNGRTAVDVIAQLLGFEFFIPPFATTRGKDVILNGVNYASGGAGIRDETGQMLGDRFTMNRQLQNHQITISQIAFILGNEVAAANYLRKCIYTVTIGSNDYINNYLVPQFYSTSRQYNPEQYATVLTQQLSQQLRTLYGYGARKVALFGVGLAGCAPAEIARFPKTELPCLNWINGDVQLFNTRLKLLVDELNRDLIGSKFIYINVTGITSGNPYAAGFTVANETCCATSMLTKGRCNPNTVPCPDRSKYVFWDGFHPTDKTNVLVASRAYKAQTPFDAHPLDIGALARL